MISWMGVPGQVDPTNESHGLANQEKTKKLPVKGTALTTPSTLSATFGKSTPGSSAYLFGLFEQEKRGEDL
jgi:hypothetical protein